MLCFLVYRWYAIWIVKYIDKPRYVNNYLLIPDVLLKYLVFAALDYVPEHALYLLHHRPVE